MLLVEFIASSFLDLISKQARPECRCKLVLVISVTHPWLFSFQNSFLVDWKLTVLTRKVASYRQFSPPTSIFAYLWQITLTLSKFTNSAVSIKIDHQEAGVNSPTPDSGLSREQLCVLNRVTGVSIFLLSTVTFVMHPGKLFRETA